MAVYWHEVIGVDCNELHVDRLKDKIATAFVLDATDELSLSTLPLKKVDIVVVAIGENFGASVKVVSILKKNKVRHIYARAVDEIHKTVLEAFSLDRILTPEKEAARMLVQLLELNSEVEPFKIDEEYYVFKFAVPSRLCGMAVNDLQLEKNFNLKIISFIRGRRVENSLGISVLDRGVENSFEENYELQPEDELVCYGMYDDFLKFWKSVK